MFAQLKGKADELVNKNLYEKAIQSYDDIIQNKDFHNESKLKNIYFNKGFCLFKIHNYDKAIECFQNAITLDDKYSKAIYYMGYSYFLKKEYKKALEVYRSGSKISDTDQKFFLEKIQSIQKIIKEISGDNESFYSTLEKQFELLKQQKITQGYFYDLVASKINAQDIKKNIAILLNFYEKNQQDFDLKPNKMMIAQTLIQIQNRFEEAIQDKELLDRFNRIYMQFMEDFHFQEDGLNDDFKSACQVIQKIYKSEAYVLKVLKKILPLKKDIEISLLLFQAYLKHSTQEYSFQVILTFYQVFSNFKFNGFKNLELLEQVIQQVMSLSCFSQKDLEEILLSFNINSIKNQPIFCFTLLIIFMRYMLRDDKITYQLGKISLDLINNLSSFLKQAKEDQNILNLILKLFFIFCYHQKLFEYIEDNKPGLFFRLPQVLQELNFKNLQKNQNYITFLLLQEAKKNKKLAFDIDLYSKVKKIIEENKNLQENYYIVGLLITNSEYLRVMLEDKILQLYLKQLQGGNHRNIILEVQLLKNIFNMLKEEKLKQLQEKFEIGHNDTQQLQQLQKMLNQQGSNFITEDYIKKIKFYEFLIIDLKLTEQVQKLSKELHKDFLRISDDMFYVLHKILLFDKFQAPKLLSRCFLDIVYEQRKKYNYIRQQKKGYIKKQECQFYNFVARMFSGIEIVQIKQIEYDSIIQILCDCVRFQSSQLSIFESLICLTRFTHKQENIQYKIWFDHKMSVTLFELFFSDNQMIKVAALELLNNLIIDKQVFVNFIKHENVKSLLIHLREILKIYISNETIIFKDEDFRFGQSGYFFSLVVSVSILISYADPSQKYEFKKEVNIVDLKSFIKQAVKNLQIQQDLIKKTDLINS